MKKILKPMLAIGALLLATIPAAAVAPPQHSRRTVIVGPVFDPFWGPWGYGYGYAPYSYYPNRGEGQVKIDSKAKDAEVFIDDAYAGTVKEMKSMWLRPGTYDLEIRARSGEKFEEKLYVVAGKTVHIHPDLPKSG